MSMKRVEVSVHDRESNLYHEQLESYIQTYLQQGYTPTQLLDYLVEKGYDEESVRQTLLFVNKKYYRGTLEIHKPSTSMHTLLFLFVGLIVLSIGVFFYFFYSSPYEFIISMSDQDIALGESLEFSIETTRPVQLQTLVTNLQGNLVVQKNDIIENSLTYYIDLPQSITQGKYVVDFVISYKDERDDASFSFSISEQTSTQTIPSLSVVAESSQQFIKALESKNPTNCKVITNKQYYDECYFILARESLDETLCESIVDSQIKEKCYFTQVINGNIISCSLLEDFEHQSICEDAS